MDGEGDRDEDEHGEDSASDTSNEEETYETDELTAR